MIQASKLPRIKEKYDDATLAYYHNTHPPAAFRTELKMLPYIISFLFAQCYLSLMVNSFSHETPPFRSTSISRPMTADQENGQKNGILSGVADFFGNLDAIADDFFYKRMGKGEVSERKNACNNFHIEILNCSVSCIVLFQLTKTTIWC